MTNASFAKYVKAEEILQDRLEIIRVKQPRNGGCDLLGQLDDVVAIITDWSRYR